MNNESRSHIPEDAGQNVENLSEQRFEIPEDRVSVFFSDLEETIANAPGVIGSEPAGIFAEDEKERYALREVVYKKFESLQLSTREEELQFFRTLMDDWVVSDRYGKHGKLNRLEVDYNIDEKQGGDILLLSFLERAAKLSDVSPLLSEDVHLMFTELIALYRKELDEDWEKGQAERDVLKESETVKLNDGYFDDSDYMWNYGNFSDSWADGHPDIVMLNKIIVNLAPRGNRDTIGALFVLLRDFGWNVKKHLPHALSRIDASYSAEKILEYLNSSESTESASVGEREEQYYRFDLSQILYRLEIGKIGISENVAEYLGKKYQLTPDRDDLALAHRITGDGKIGLFDKDEALVGYFELGDLADPTVQRQAEVLDISRELLFADPDADDRIREEFLQTYLTFFQDVFFKETHIQSNNLSLREQLWFFQFLKQADADTRSRVERLTKKFGEDALKCFVSFESDPQILEQLEIIATHMGEADAMIVFHQYAEAETLADDLRSVFLPLLSDRGLSKEDEARFFEDINARAHGFLTYVAEESEKEKGEKTTYHSLQEKMKEEYRAFSAEDCADGVVAEAVVALVNRFGDVETRALLDKAYNASTNPIVKNRVNAAVNRAYGLITPDVRTQKEMQAVRSVSELYEDRVAFETYALNDRMTEVEIDLLTREIGKDETALDLGFGTGRHLLPLRERGLHISGIDATERHVALVREKDPELDVKNGDWKDTKYDEASFDVIYSLGRNILHETTLAGQEALFAEAARVLKPGGKFMIDIPDRTRGWYKESADKYAHAMKERGISSFRYGTVYDSPNGKDFMTRYVYSHEDIERLAEDNGFVIERMEETELKNGKGDVNRYYVLRKKPAPAVASGVEAEVSAPALETPAFLEAA